MSKIPIAIDAQKGVPSVSSSQRTSTVRSRSRKIPSSFHYGSANTTSQTQMNTSNELIKQEQQQQQHRYAAQTISSFMKKSVIHTVYLFFSVIRYLFVIF